MQSGVDRNHDYAVAQQPGRRRWATVLLAFGVGVLVGLAVSSVAVLTVGRAEASPQVAAGTVPEWRPEPLPREWRYERPDFTLDDAIYTRD